MSVPRTFTALIASALRASVEKIEAACRTASHPSRARSTAAGSVTSPMAADTEGLERGGDALGSSRQDADSVPRICQRRDRV
jgi:hypothetical protein